MINQHIKDWLSANEFDGEDRSKADADWSKFSAPDLYELFNDLAEHLKDIGYVQTNEANSNNGKATK